MNLGRLLKIAFNLHAQLSDDHESQEGEGGAQAPLPHPYRPSRDQTEYEAQNTLEELAETQDAKKAREQAILDALQQVQANESSLPRTVTSLPKERPKRERKRKRLDLERTPMIAWEQITEAAPLEEKAAHLVEEAEEEGEDAKIALRIVFKNVPRSEWGSAMARTLWTQTKERVKEAFL